LIAEFAVWNLFMVNVAFCEGSGLCDELITGSEEFYRL
jgi:hypothetical protein